MGDSCIKSINVVSFEALHFGKIWGFQSFFKFLSIYKYFCSFNKNAFFQIIYSYLLNSKRKKAVKNGRSAFHGNYKIEVRKKNEF